MSLAGAATATGHVRIGGRPAAGSARLAAPVDGGTAAMSAFVPNTPLVAMFAPRVVRWSQRHGVNASRYPDAVVVREHPRRRGHADRHVDEPGGLRRARAIGGRTARAVRDHGGRSAGRGGRGRGAVDRRRPAAPRAGCGLPRPQSPGAGVPDGGAHRSEGAARGSHDRRVGTARHSTGSSSR